MAVYKSKTPTKDGRQYFFRIKYKDIFGNIHDYSSQKFKTSKEAKNEEALYRIKVANNETCTTSITFFQVFNEYILELSKNVKPQTIIRNKYLFEQLKPIHNIKINDFNLNNLKQLQYELEKKNYSIDYLNKIIETLRRLIVYSNKYYNTNAKMLNFIMYTLKCKLMKEIFTG